MMPSKIVDQNSGEQVDRTTARLRKLAALQGFVTEAQIEEVAQTSAERARVQKYSNGKTSGSTLLSKKRIRRSMSAACAEWSCSRRHAPVCRSDLGLFEYGRAGAAPVTRAKRWNMRCRWSMPRESSSTWHSVHPPPLKASTASPTNCAATNSECIDVLQVDEDQVQGEEEIENLRGEFLKIVSSSKEKFGNRQSAKGGRTEGFGRRSAGNPE